jgi:hypothetical protein
MQSLPEMVSIASVFIEILPEYKKCRKSVQNNKNIHDCNLIISDKVQTVVEVTKY